MRAKRAFFYSFFLSLSVMGSMLGVMWAGLKIDSLQAGTPAPKVSVLSPGAEDSKTVLIKSEAGGTPYYFLIKLNAIENKVCSFVISPRYKEIDSVADIRGLGAARDILREALGVSIDYYLSIDENEARIVCQNFHEVDITDLGTPVAISEWILKNANSLDADSFINRIGRSGGLLDNGVGLEFISRYTASLIRANLTDNAIYAIKRVRRCYSQLETDMNTNSLERLEIIAKYLSKGTAEVTHGIILRQDENAREKINLAFGVE